jgi:hypothetical protein
MWPDDDSVGRQSSRDLMVVAAVLAGVSLAGVVATGVLMFK